MTYDISGVVFVHDHKFRKIDNRIYSTGGLSEEALNRYVKVFGKVTVIARIIEEESTNHRYSEILSPFITIINGASISKKEFEVIISDSNYVISRMPSLLGFKAAKVAKKNNVPYLIEVVGCARDALWNHSVQGKMISFPSYISMKNIIRNAKYVLYVTSDYLQKKYPTNGKTVNCSNVSINTFDSGKLNNKINKIKNKKNDSKVIVGTTAAVDVRYKGQQYVIEAIGKLKAQGITNIEYQMVGGGNQAYLKSLSKKFNVADQVKFIGSIPHDEIFEWLENIDLYVQPSKTEGLPRSLIEAMSEAVPAFGANAGGIPELLDSEYIYSNSGGNIGEICTILKRFDKNKQIEQAKRNFEESKKYDRSIIEERRNMFLIEFKKSV